MHEHDVPTASGDCAFRFENRVSSEMRYVHVQIRSRSHMGERQRLIELDRVAVDRENSADFILVGTRHRAGDGDRIAHAPADRRGLQLQGRCCRIHRAS